MKCFSSLYWFKTWLLTVILFQDEIESTNSSDRTFKDLINSTNNSTLLSEISSLGRSSHRFMKYDIILTEPYWERM